MTDGADTLERVWSRAVASLTDGELTHQQRAWLTLTRPLGLMEDTALLAAPNEFTQNMLETRLRPLITEALSAALGRDIRVAVTIESSPPPANLSPPPAPTDPNPPGHPASGHPASGHQVRSPFAPPGDQRDVSPPGDEPQLTYGETVDSRGEHRGEPVDRPVDSRGLRLVDNHYSLGPPGSDRLPPRDQPQDRRHDRDEPHQGPGLTVYEGGRSMDTDHAPPVDTGFGSSDSGPADYRSADHRERTGQITGQSIGRSSGVNEDTGWSGSPGPVRESGLDLGAPRSRPRSTDPIRLNPKYTFETFVIGSSNRFAHAAAVAVAEAPAKAYNPLFVYGESGLGKTHLLHAIGHYAHRLFPHIRVRYVSTEEFTNDFINLVHSGKAEDFRRRYRDVDVLLVDDIQFLERAERTQEEFFHTFNTLHNANKQIVITSDRPPKQLTTLEDRLRTRFEWGLITDVQAPDLETRIAILRKKAAQENLKAPADVLEFIATKIQSNIRELEGALIRVTAFASLNRQGVDVSLAEVVLKDLIPDSGGPEITAATIMAVTAEYFSVSIDDLCSMSRSRVLVTARQIAMYLCRELTDLSLPRIGQTFGGKDHTTVMHAVKKVSGLMAERRSIYNQVTELTNRIKARARQ